MNHERLLLQILALVLVVLLLVACSTVQSSPTATDTSIEETDTPTTERSETPSTPSGGPVRILFVGNSFTLYNDLPGTFADLARSGGHQVEFEVAALGGWSLFQHAASETTLEKLERQLWDYVILQERSDIPAIAEQREKQMYPAIRLLGSKTEESETQTILFMTWGRRDGLPEAGLSNYAAMLGQIHAGYMEIANESNTLVAPVGLAWQAAMEHDQDLDLWAYDEIHPNELGTYLAAAVFYTVIFQQNPEGLAYWAQLPEDKAHFLQTIAAESVLEDVER